jgi:hypothetical protein
LESYLQELYKNNDEGMKMKKKEQCNHNIDLDKRCERCEEFDLMQKLGKILK